MSKEGSDLMKRAHELAPFVADALHEVAAEARYPDPDKWDLTEKEKASRDFAVELTEKALSDNARRGTDLIDTVLAHAEAARDAEVNDE